MPVDFSKVKLVGALLGDGQERLYTYTLPTDGQGTMILLRPMLGDEAEQFFARDGAALDKGAKEFPGRCKGWNARNPVDPSKVAPITEAMFRKLPHPVQKWAIDCMTGYGLAVTENGPTEQGEAEKN